MTPQAAVAAAVFLVVYGLIVTEKIHRTLAALLGASVIMLVAIVPQHAALTEHVDFNVIFLLAGMMVIANILAKTGIFQWIAVEAVRRAQGRPYALLVMTSLVTAVASMFLDNVTTVVLTTPITFFVAQRLGTSPVAFLISQVLASNIGGAATLIGDPPNIIIGSRLGKDFNDFLVNALPPCAVALALYLVFARWLFRQELREAVSALEPEDIERLVRDERRIADVPLMRKSLVVIAFTIAGFLVARPLGLEGATIALTGAVVLMIIARQDVHEVLAGIEWSTLFFFIGLFIVVGGLVETGVIAAIAQAALALTGGSTDASTMLLLWMSAVLSAIVDNIPYTITMIPLVEEMSRAGVRLEPLVWALSLGANLGGNATVIGASANVVVSSMSEARGHPIPFMLYLRYGVPATLLTMVVATVYVWVRYLVLT
ncbi:MAG TPA: ArsB/NhaD family transporter [Candidatus Limnocylindria bacterium]|nr:ArsB/NhaD family transporter [Candidatus Limnocylindria bacterium]